MNAPRFLQIHCLHSYAAALLNRDDSGLAKRLTYGGVSRTRISSQCLKRHWRMAREVDDEGTVIRDDPHALQHLAGYVDSSRSRQLVTEKVIAPLRERFPEDVVAALSQWFQWAIYSGKADKKPKKRGEKEKADDKKGRPTLLFGQPELNWLQQQFRDLAEEAGNDADIAFKLGSKWSDSFKETIKLWRENNCLPAGLVAALFGRMVTSDPAANIDAPVHVAHAFTVHGEESESDYFTAVDDLKKDEDDSGADTIQETELTSGLFYGYVVIDLPALVSNCGGDKDLAGRVIDHLVHLIAEVSPGAKLGSTAPYGRAGFMLLEVGDRQPRSLAESFRKPAKPDLDAAVVQLSKQLGKFDHAYATGERRICLNLSDAPLDGAPTGSIADLGRWAQGKVLELADV
jgi:CRISPR system Cascade subunit CasC